MKKFSAFILTLLYLVASTGAAFNVHYCMGKLQSIDMVSTAKCSNCGMEKDHSGCCKDELKVIKLKDSHQPGGSQMFLNPPYAVLNIYHNTQSFLNEMNRATVVIHNNSPPLPAHSLYMMNCVFRI